MPWPRGLVRAGDLRDARSDQVLVVEDPALLEVHEPYPLAVPALDGPGEFGVDAV